MTGTGKIGIFNKEKSLDLLRKGGCRHYGWGIFLFNQARSTAFNDTIFQLYLSFWHLIKTHITVTEITFIVSYYGTSLTCWIVAVSCDRDVEGKANISLPLSFMFDSSRLTSPCICCLWLRWVTLRMERN